jgi:DNA polymerase-3 subunit delta'
METLAELEDHPHAKAVLGPALGPHGRPSHAYLFHGPSGAGKRGVARAFAAALLADGARDPRAVGARVARGSHPDLTWVTPSGASEMLVGDIDEPVVAAATRTPFESRRRVFVIEGAQTLNDQAANRMLKTLEEPPSYVHLILLAERREDVLATIASRCQHVRFDPPGSARIEQRLRGDAEVDADQALRLAACARLALGDTHLAEALAGERGQTLREGAERFVLDALEGSTGERAWLSLLDAAKAAGGEAGEAVQERLASEAELLPSKERKRHEREGVDAKRRAERRARTATLDLALRLAELWLRDALCLAQGAGELIHAVDRREQLARAAAGRDVHALRRGVQLIAETRLRLTLNVSEELALEALAYGLQALGDAAPAAPSSPGHPLRAL